MVERVIGNDEVGSSILPRGTIVFAQCAVIYTEKYIQKIAFPLSFHLVLARLTLFGEILQGIPPTNPLVSSVRINDSLTPT